MQAVMRRPLKDTPGLPNLDTVLLMVVGLLLCFSLVMVFSATVMVDQETGGGLNKIAKHTAHVFVGILGALLISMTQQPGGKTRPPGYWSWGYCCSFWY